MCSLTIECVLLLQDKQEAAQEQEADKDRMCSLTIECVLLLQNVFSYYRMCSPPIECVLLLSNVFSCCRTSRRQRRSRKQTMKTDWLVCLPLSGRRLRTLNERSPSLTVECVLLLQNVFSYYRMSRPEATEREVSPSLTHIYIVQVSFAM